MLGKKEQQLSSSLEDYLEVILNLLTENQAAHSKDIAQAMGVAGSSVTGALRQLKKKKLVNYKPYGTITLTEKGRLEAIRVAKSHEVIKEFFVSILGVDEKTAGRAACKAEHALGSKIVNRLTNFMDFVKFQNTKAINIADDFKKYCTENKNNPLSNFSQRFLGDNLIPLSQALPGQELKIAGIDSGESLKGRLTALGLIPNTKISIVSNEKPGPFVINIKGSKIALGRGMVDKIMVEII